MSMGTYYGLCLLWIFVHLTCAQIHPSTVPVPPLQWIRLKPTGTNVGPALAYSAAGYDYINKQLVLFGGETSGGLIDSNTYLFDMSTMAWTTPNPTINQNIKPPGRSRALYGHDQIASYRNGFLIYGGKGQQGPLSDVWEYVFTGQFWYNVTNIQGDIPSARYSATGGGDPPSASNSDPNLLTTFWLTGGVETGPDGSPTPVAYNDLYRLQMSGAIAGNIQNPVATWTKMASSQTGNATSRISQAGLAMRTLEGEATLGYYGGCASTSEPSVACAQQDAHVIGTASGGQWNDIVACPSARLGASFVANYNHLFSDMAFLVLGLSPSTNATDVQELGTRGEIDVLSISQGTWSRVLPSCDPESTPPCPVPREGAAVVSSASTMAAASNSSAASAASDIIIFGGRDKDGNVLNDIWVLRATTAEITYTNQTNWSALYGNGTVGSGPNTNGQGVTVEFLTDCAQNVSRSSSTPGPTGQSPSTNGIGTQQTVPAYIAGTSHKVLAASSVMAVFAAVAFSRSIGPSHGRGAAQPFTRGLVGLIACISWVLGIAGFAASFASTEINPESTSSLQRRDGSGDAGFVKTDHAIVGTILFGLAYVLVPLVVLGRRWMMWREYSSARPVSPVTSHQEDKGPTPRRSNVSAPMSEHRSRPGLGRVARQSLSIHTRTVTSEDQVDMLARRSGDGGDDEPIGAGKRVRLAQGPLPAPTAFFREHFSHGRLWVTFARKRERVPSHPSPPPLHSRADSTSPTTPLNLPTEGSGGGGGGGGFVVLNRGRNALDRRTPPPQDQYYPRRSPATLGEVSWLERRRNVHMVSDLDYAMSQQHARTSQQHSSPLVTPSTQHSKPLLSSHLDAEAEEVHRRISPSHEIAEFPALWTVVFHCVFHLILFALAVFTASSIFQRGGGTLATPLGAAFVALLFAFYAFLVFLAIRGLPEGSIAAVVVSRLRADHTATLHEAEGERIGLGEYVGTPEAKHGLKDTSTVVDSLAHESSSASRAFLQRSRYSGELSDGRNEVRGDANGEDDAEDIEREMERRDVSIVTVPRRRLFIANSGIA